MPDALDDVQPDAIRIPDQESPEPWQLDLFPDPKDPATGPYRVALASTGFAVILALLPALTVATGASVEYDPTIAVLTATLIALIWTAYHTFQGVQHSRAAAIRADATRDAEAASLMASVSSELQYLAAALKAPNSLAFWTGFDALSHPQLTSALSRPDLFPAVISDRLAHLANNIRLAKFRAFRIEAERGEETGDEAKLEKALKSHARQMIEQIDTLSEMLLTQRVDLEDHVAVLKKRMVRLSPPV